MTIPKNLDISGIWGISPSQRARGFVAALRDNGHVEQVVPHGTITGDAGEHGVPMIFRQGFKRRVKDVGGGLIG